MEVQIYGIDLAKDKFDVNYFDAKKQKEVHKVVKNTMSGINKFLCSLTENAYLCAEHTGVYGDLLLVMANNQGVRISYESGYKIKHSLGLQRGKSDPLDCKRIREYGERFFDKLKETKAPSEFMAELKELFLVRDELVQTKKRLQTADTNSKLKPYNSIVAHNIRQMQLQQAIASINKIESEILLLIQTDEECLHSYEIITSIKGVGLVTAVELILDTINFTKMETAAQCAAYAGIAPYPNSSGTIAHKSHTSPMANKKLKTLLYICAHQAYSHNKEFKLYYEKKTIIQKRHHYYAINAIANKLLRLIYSLIRKDVFFDPNFVRLDPRMERAS